MRRISNQYLLKINQVFTWYNILCHSEYTTHGTIFRSINMFIIFIHFFLLLFIPSKAKIFFEIKPFTLQPITSEFIPGTVWDWPIAAKYCSSKTWSECPGFCCRKDGSKCQFVSTAEMALNPVSSSLIQKISGRLFKFHYLFIHFLSFRGRLIEFY